MKLVQTPQNSPGESGSSGLGSPVPDPGVSQSIPGKWEHHPDEAGWDAAQVKHSLNKLELGKKGVFSLKNKESGGSQEGQSCPGSQEAAAQVSPGTGDPWTRGPGPGKSSVQSSPHQLNNQSME